ncbi:unnamed protein product [Coregonus sp. 'balchen']|nr:unnamed protein product [Coregonus sp. 'balchen']
MILCVVTDFHSMSNVRFSATRGSTSGGPDKVDMSLGKAARDTVLMWLGHQKLELDDIIRLNKKEQQAKRQGLGNSRPLQKGKGFVQGS